jgi:hypothetical protein
MEIESVGARWEGVAKREREVVRRGKTKNRKEVEVVPKGEPPRAIGAGELSQRPQSPPAA